MTTTTQVAIPKAKVQLPTNYAEDMAAEAAAIARRLAAPSGDTIRVRKDKSFELPNGDTSEVITGVLVDFVSMNQYYPGKYDPKDIKPPVCYAIGTDLDDMKPSPKGTDIQNKDCKTCWANQWGTDGKGKACKNQRLLGILAPDMQEDGPLLLIKVAPTGTRYLDAHVKSVTSLAGSTIKVITEIICDPNPEVEYASLRFKALGPNDNWEAAYARKKDARARLLTEPDYGAAAVEPPAEKPKGKGK